jgi:hypothetical protein
MMRDAIIPWDVIYARRIRVLSGVIPRESGGSSTHRAGAGTLPSILVATGCPAFAGHDRQRLFSNKPFLSAA